MHRENSTQSPRKGALFAASVLILLAGLPAAVGCRSEAKREGTDKAAAPVTASSASAGAAASAAPPKPLPPMEMSKLGVPCASDAECGGMTCLLEKSGVFTTEGPARGYCSFECREAPGKAACESAGACLGTGPKAFWCFQPCVLGSEQDAGPKCRGRTDVACSPLPEKVQTAQAKAACLPLCASDEDCAASGRHCNLEKGTCGDLLPAGDPVGASCKGGEYAGPSCAGECLGVPARGASGSPETVNICSSPCVQGSATACGRPKEKGALASGKVAGACAFGAAGTAKGDLGYCAQLCDANTDCARVKDASCDKSKHLLETYGHGVCSYRVPPPAADAGAKPHPKKESNAPVLELR